MRFILLGPPAAGKGTQSTKLSEYYGIPAISTGNIIRKNISEKTELGIKAKTYIDSGKLVPDELVIDLVKDRLKADDCKNGYILDGFPRTLAQAKVMEELGIEIDKVIEITVADEEIIKRISGRRNCEKCGAIYNTHDNPSKLGDKCEKCGGNLVQRADDTEETVKNRLDVYHAETQPVNDYYAQKGDMIVINSCGTVEETTAALWKALGVTK